MLQAELKILGGKHQGKLIPLNFKKFLVGREQDCHLRPNSDLVSRHHCVFSIDDYAVRLRDLGSTNGTMVNGKNIRGEVMLKAGDRVSIGKLDLEVVVRTSASNTVSRPAEPRPVAPVAEPLPVVGVSESPTPTDEVETNFEMAVYQEPAQQEPVPEAPADTAIIGASQPQLQPQLQVQPQPQMQPQAPVQQPAPVYPGGYPQMAPPGYPMPGAYMPPQYPQYPYGQPPGFAPPMGYPMPYAPQMMPMQQPYPGVAVAAPAAPTAVEDAPQEDSAAPEVRLPKPEDTGAKVTGPPVGSGGAGGGTAAAKPSTTAADIIKQYMSKRT